METFWEGFQKEANQSKMDAEMLKRIGEVAAVGAIAGGGLGYLYSDPPHMPYSTAMGIGAAGGALAGGFHGFAGDVAAQMKLEKQPPEVQQRRRKDIARKKGLEGFMNAFYDTFKPKLPRRNLNAE
jgi:hypothetical protein